ncbi:MAG: phosphonate C-P lyase system protein PhnH [Shimia sp.]
MEAQAQAQALEGGFAQPPQQSAHAFRAIMEAMARPGRIEALGGATAPAPTSVAAATVLMTLCDADTPVWIAPSHDCDELRGWLAFHTGAPLSGPGECAFALGTWNALMPLAAYPVGTPEYPDRSATLIVEMPALSPEGATLRGPGVDGTASLWLPEAAPFRANHARYPLGLDFLFTAGDRIAALPRSTEVC